MHLLQHQQKRYHRHIILRHVGEQGQYKILNAKVLVIGTGGLGSPVLYYLAASGVGTIGIVDGDLVDISNLHRQILHNDNDIDLPKVESAENKLKQINPEVKLIVMREFLTADNIKSIVMDYDFIIECTDNFNSKFLINDACVQTGKPFSYGGVLRFEGQTMTVQPNETACLRCIFREVPSSDSAESCKKSGILGSVPGIIGTIQATEALKFLIGSGQLLTNRMIFLDAFNMKTREINVDRDLNCPVCGEFPKITDLAHYVEPATVRN